MLDQVIDNLIQHLSIAIIMIINNKLYNIFKLIFSVIFLFILLCSCSPTFDLDKSLIVSPTRTTKEEFSNPATSYPPNPAITPYRYPVPTYEEIPLIISQPDQSQKGTLEGTGIILGELFSATNNAGIPKTMFFLIKAGGEKHNVPSIITGPNKDDLIFYTNEQGYFTIYNFEPGYYYLVMAAPPYDWAIGYEDTSILKPLLIEVKPNETTSLGRIIIYWP